MRSRSSGVVVGSGTGVRPLLDAVAAAVVVGVFWLPPTIDVADRPRLAAGLVLAAVTGVAMLVRRRFPAHATATAGVSTVAGGVLGVCQDPMLATAWCLYSLAVARAVRTRALVVVVAGVFAALAAVTGVPQTDGGGSGQRLVLAVAALSVSFLLGTAVARQVAAARDAERARVQLEVARDVHDVVGHALGVISAEAGVTRGLADTTERELRDSLADIEAHARRALEEMQALVRALRDAPGPADGAGRPVVTAAVSGLSSVVATTRSAGVRVDTCIDVPAGVDDAVGAVVFRIVQESLSNVVRHASGARCAVDVHGDGAAIVVRAGP
ncbi:MAG TPA: histidine kinase [Catenuloplanes sp.]